MKDLEGSEEILEMMSARERDLAGRWVIECAEAIWWNRGVVGRRPRIR